MRVYYDSFISSLDSTTEEEKDAIKVLEYKKAPDENKRIEDYVEMAAKNYAKLALTILFADLKKAACEKGYRSVIVNVWIVSTAFVQAIGRDVSGKFSFSPNSNYSFLTPSVQECVFNGIYGEKAKKAFLKQIQELLKPLGTPLNVDDIFLYENISIIFPRNT
ncbi:MAG: hypothetical protein J6C46_11110 [Clostridia bacterium]|nr:hypothetical protein [Clostridia bacterium]